MVTLEDIDKEKDLEKWSHLVEVYRRQEAQSFQERMAAAEQTHNLTRVSLRLSDYDGESLPLDDFMQIARMGSAELNDPALEKSYLKIVLAHIKGRARTAIRNQTVQDLDHLESLLLSATTPTKTYSEYVKLMWSAKMRTGESAKEFYDRMVGYKTAAATALKKDLPPTANQANAVAHLEYLAIDAFIEGLPDGWRTSFAAVAPTSLEQALSTAQAQERYRVPTGSNTTKICQLLRENLTLTGPTDLAQGAASSIPTAAATMVQHSTPSSQPQKHRSKSKRRSRRHESSSDESGDESSSNEHSKGDKRKGSRKCKQPQVIYLPPPPRYVDFASPDSYHRHIMPYYYDRNDTAFRGSYIEQGRINAPAQLSYYQEHPSPGPSTRSRTPPPYSSSTPSRSRSPYREAAGYYPPQYYPLPILPPQPYYYPRHPQQPSSSYRPRETTPDRSVNYHNARESLNSSGARRQDATTSNTETQRPTVRFEEPERSAISTQGASHRQYK